MIDTLPVKYMNSAWLLHGLLSESIGNIEQSKFDFKKAIANDEISADFLNKHQPITMNLFPDMDRLCTLFPQIEISFDTHPPLV